MKKFFRFETLTVGFAIFSMFFGAGNLMYPIKVGMSSGSHFITGMFAFLITSVLLPFLGLIAMILFKGDYKEFLFRIGKIPGYILLICCMLIIGPMIGIPRIVTLSYTMMAPFIPKVSLFIFILLFLVATFLCTFKENRIVDLLGKFISPVLLISLAIIIFKGFFNIEQIAQTNNSVFDIFKENFWRGYETLDLIAAIFFSSIILTILKNIHKIDRHSNMLAFLGFKSGLIGVSLLALIYIGMGFLGLYHGSNLVNINTGELFREVSFKVLGLYGAAIIGTTVFMACLSTAIALSAVVAEFLQVDILKRKISFALALVLVLLSCIPLSLSGLGTVLKFTAGPITYIGYPILISMTFLNIAYKLFEFKPIKLPVLLVALLALISYMI